MCYVVFKASGDVCNKQHTQTQYHVMSLSKTLGVLTGISVNTESEYGRQWIWNNALLELPYSEQFKCCIEFI